MKTEKKTNVVKKLMMAAAISALMISHAQAATPKANVSIMSDKITLGDVFDDVTADAGHVLAPAPAMGQTMMLNANDLTRISNAFHLGWTSTTNLEQVVIRRSSTTIDRHDIQAALQEKLKTELKGQKFEIELNDRSISFNVGEKDDRTVDVVTLKYDAAKEEFLATVATAGHPNVKKDVKGKVYQVAQLPVLRESLRQGDLISASDIEYIDIRSRDISSSMVVDTKRLVGQTPRRGINAMKPIMITDVQSPIVVKKGDLVTMTLKTSIASITAQGRAMGNGAEGDEIQVMNTTSKQIIGATVAGPSVVSVKPPESTL